MKKFLIVCLSFMTMKAATAQMEKTVMVGGAAMYPSKNIVECPIGRRKYGKWPCAFQGFNKTRSFYCRHQCGMVF